MLNTHCTLHQVTSEARPREPSSAAPVGSSHRSAWPRISLLIPRKCAHTYEHQGADAVALRGFFSLFGSIIDIKVVSVGKMGLSEGHILFDSPDAVDKVLMPENLGTLPCEVQPLCTFFAACARVVTLVRVVRTQT
jgi:hypothetical protein